MTDFRRWITLCETDELAAVRGIAVTFREWMEGKGFADLAHDVGYGDISRAGYNRFEGMCNAASRRLAAIYVSHGYDAVSDLMEYHGDDLLYWQRHGMAFYDSEEEFEDAEPWEHGESHEVVVINGSIIVDVTSDQFNPSDPEAHRVVVTHMGDQRYR